MGPRSSGRLTSALQLSRDVSRCIQISQYRGKGCDYLLVAKFVDEMIVRLSTKSKSEVVDLSAKTVQCALVGSKRGGTSSRFKQRFALSMDL